MKKTMLWSALFALVCSQGQAEDTQQIPSPQATQLIQAQNTGNNLFLADNKAQQAQTTQTRQDSNLENQNLSGTRQAVGTLDSNTSTPFVDNEQPNGVKNSTTQQISPSEQQPTTHPVEQSPTQQQNNNTTNQPNPLQSSQSNPQSSSNQQQPPVINCEYKMPLDNKIIDQSWVLTWSEKAILQSFDFNPASVDSQVQRLQPCFTEQGWTGFQTALQKSGNIEAIKSQHLTVSSQIDGQGQITVLKENQWKVNFPLQVVYQNDKEKVTQLLSVDLTVGRKINGDLGIVQIIASPRGRVDVKKIPTNQSGFLNASTPVNNNAAPNFNTNQPLPSSNTTEQPPQQNTNSNNGNTQEQNTPSTQSNSNQSTTSTGN